MDKLMIASDLHGSARYSELLLHRFRQEGAERLLLLGDLLYHGPRNDLPEGYAPKQVIELLNGVREHLLCVRGNCDGEVDQMVLDFPILAEYAVLTWGGRALYAVHGHRPLPPLLPRDVVVQGHTHIPGWQRREEGFTLTPGSVSLPKNGSRRSYLTAEGTVFSWKDLTTGETWQTLDLEHPEDC